MFVFLHVTSFFIGAVEQVEKKGSVSTKKKTIKKKKTPVLTIMGITGLSKALKKFAPRAITPVDSVESLGALFNHEGRAGIDAAIFVWKFKSVGFDVGRAFRNQVERFRQARITPYYFFDGTPCAAKTDEVTARRESKNQLRETLRASELELNQVRAQTMSTLSFAQIAAAENAVHKQRERLRCMPAPADFVLAKQTLLQLGVPVYQSKHDGEKACAWATKCGLVDFVVTEDYDSLTYGATRVVTRWGGKNDMLLYDLSTVLQDMGKRDQPWTQSQFVDYCILLGSDLCAQRIKGIGPVTAKRMVDTHLNMETILQYLDRNKYTPPDHFPFQAARDEFGDATPQAQLMTRA